jgi:hypothetical protein
MATKTPRELFQKKDKHQVVRSLRQQTTSTNNDDEVDLPAIVAALSNTDVQTCFLCSADDHKMVQCPTYQRLRDNPRAVTAILRGLKSQHNSNRRSSGPPHHVRQVCTTCETHIPNEIGEGYTTDLEAGEGDSSDDDETAVHANPADTDDHLDPDFL